MKPVVFALPFVALLACKGRETKNISADPAAAACSCAPCAPQPSTALSLDIPKASSGSTLEAPALHVTITSDAKLSVDGEPVADDDALRALARKSYVPEKRAVILADRGVAHGVVIRVLDVLKSAGFDKISIGVSPP